jgi:SAM-dependent methyltransferase
MTPEMRERARNAAVEAGLTNVEFRSKGVLNLVPDKGAALDEMYRVLKPGGRLQIGDILVQVQVPEEAKLEIDLWTG